MKEIKSTSQDCVIGEGALTASAAKLNRERAGRVSLIAAPRAAPAEPIPNRAASKTADFEGRARNVHQIPQCHQYKSSKEKEFLRSVFVKNNTFDFET
jgi:hypothetical protein